MIKKKTSKKYMEIDLTGEQGNAFVLLGITKKLCLIADKDYDKISMEMKSGDYDKRSFL